MTMQTLAAAASLEQSIRHSRFLAQAEPVTSLAEIDLALERLCRPQASHHCWAWRLGESYRSSDDGEPAGTAGRPILAAIDGQGLRDVLVVVSRWFGGIKLGSGGLVRAYGGTAAECLRLASRRLLVERVPLLLRCAAADLGTVRHLLAAHDALIQCEDWQVDGLSMLVQVVRDNAVQLRRALLDGTSGRVQMTT
jgi:uncharacterized YigZ family protein